MCTVSISLSDPLSESQAMAFITFYLPLFFFVTTLVTCPLMILWYILLMFFTRRVSFSSSSYSSFEVIRVVTLFFLSSLEDALSATFLLRFMIFFCLHLHFMGLQVSLIIGEVYFLLIIELF